MIALMILRGIAIYAITRLLVKERGMGAIFERLREWAGVVRLEQATADQLNAYLEMSGETMTDPSELPDQIATTELGMALLCLYCTGALVTVPVMLLSANYVGALLLVEMAAAYGVHVLIAVLTERLEE